MIHLASHEIGPPPLDVSGVTCLPYAIESSKKRYQLESTRRTLEAMVKDGLLEKVVSYEQRQDTSQSGDSKGIWCNCSRYGLPSGTALLGDTGGKREAIEGESVRVA